MRSPTPDLDRCLACQTGVLDARLGGMCGDYKHGECPSDAEILLRRFARTAYRMGAEDARRLAIGVADEAREALMALDVLRAEPDWTCTARAVALRLRPALLPDQPDPAGGEGDVR